MKKTPIRQAAAAFAALLVAGAGAGCRSGDGSTSTSPSVAAAPANQAPTVSLAPAGPVVALPGQGYAQLGRLSGATVELFDLHRVDPIFATVTDANGFFRLDTAGLEPDALYRVRVTGGSDLDFNDDGQADAQPVPHAGDLTALATGRQLATNGVRVTVLSDLLARQAQDRLAFNPAGLVLREFDQAAEDLLLEDLNNDGELDYLDVLAFDPAQAEHQDALSFDYGDLFLEDDKGDSVMDLYHRNDARLGDALNALLADRVDIVLPDIDQAPLAALDFGVAGPGTLASGELPLTLDEDTGRYRKAFARDGRSIRLTATPLDGATFTAWENCTPDALNPRSCTTTADASKTVIAVFDRPETPLSSNTLLHIPATAGLVLSDDDREFVVTALASDPLVAKLDAALGALASHPLYLGGDKAEQATLEVTRLTARRELRGVVRFDLEGQPARVIDAATEGAFYAPRSALSVDTITGLRVNTGGGEQSIPVQGGANEDDTSGPDPVRRDLDARVCGGPDFVQRRLLDDRVACLSLADAPVDAPACPSDRPEVEALDGEYFCVAPQNVRTAAEVDAIYAANPATAQAKSLVLETRAKALLAQPVTTRPGLPALTPGQRVWLVGQGQALYLAHNVFLVDKPDRTGVRMVTVEDPATAQTVSPASRPALAWQRCSSDASAPECALFQPASASSASSSSSAGGQQAPAKANLLPLDFETTFKPQDWLSVKVRANVDLTGEASSNFDFSIARQKYDFGSRGLIQITPFIDTTVTATHPELFDVDASDPSKRTEKKKARKSGDALVEQTLIKVDFLQAIPGVNTVSPVLESSLEAAIGIDADGTAKINLYTDYKQVVAWDIVSRYEVKYFSDNVNHHDVRLNSRGFPGAKLSGQINGTAGYYGKAGITMGPRGIMPKLASFEAKYYPLRADAVGEFLVSYQTEPEKVAAQKGQNFCWAGRASLSVKEAAEAKAKIEISLKDGPLKFLSDYVGSKKWEWTVYSFERELWRIGTETTAQKTQSPAAGNGQDETNNGQKTKPESSDKLACAAPAADQQPASREYTPGMLRADAGRSFFIQTHELTMQVDGNLVLYAWNGKRGAPVWASNTNGQGLFGGKFGRVSFQDDGNLVVEDVVGRPTWSSGTNGLGATRLVLAARGALEIYNGDGLLWTSDKGLQPSNAPASLERAPGGLTLREGELLRTRTRLLVMQADGNLVLYRLENGRQQNPLWASGTPGAGQGSRADFQADGNLVVYDRHGAPKWASGTSNRGATRLALQDDGNMVIYAGGRALWATGTQGR